MSRYAAAILICLASCASPQRPDPVRAAARARIVNLRAEISLEKVQLIWNLEWSPGELVAPLVFRVERRTGDGWETIAQVQGTVAEDPGCPRGAETTYRVSSPISESIVITVRAPEPRVLNLTAEVTPQRVLLSWRLEGGAETLRIDRRVGSVWNVLGESWSGSFEDRSFPAGEEIEYRIGSDRIPRQMVKVLTPPLFRLEILGADKKEILIRITKNDRKWGTASIHQACRQGDRIGWWKEGSERAADKGATDEKIDWNTKLVLRSCSEKSMKVRVNRCRPSYDGEWRQTACNRQSLEIPYRGYEVVCTDDRGKEIKILSPDPASDENYKPSFCPFHKDHPNEPFMANGVDRAELARRLLAEADRLWAKRPDEAIPTYKRLLTEFSDAPAVWDAKNRIQRRAEQDD